MQAILNLVTRQVIRPKDQEETSSQPVAVRLNVFNIYLGHHLGLYQALVLGHPSTASDLALWLDIDERFVRDWLEQQANAGILEIENPEAKPATRRFYLPPVQAERLVDLKNGNNHPSQKSTTEPTVEIEPTS